MKKIVFALILAMSCLSVAASGPVHVIITAGQSNTDGRTPNKDLPQYIKALSKDTTYAQGKYRYCRIAQNDAKGKFVPFWPHAGGNEKRNMWAYDAVTYYWLEQLLKEQFYVVKWAIGGTSIAPNYKAEKGQYWSAAPDWLAQTKATSDGGKSLLLSFIQEIDVCIDQTLSKQKEGYQIDAFLWHQGESDYRKGKEYYDNLKTVVTYVRTYLSKKTGKDYSKLPFIFGTVAKANKCYSSEVEAAMKRLSEEDPNAYLINMSDATLLRDRLHFDAESAEYLGREMYNRLDKIIKGDS